MNGIPLSTINGIKTVSKNQSCEEFISSQSERCESNVMSA